MFNIKKHYSNNRAHNCYPIFMLCPTKEIHPNLVAYIQARTKACSKCPIWSTLIPSIASMVMEEALPLKFSR